MENRVAYKKSVYLFNVYAIFQNESFVISGSSVKVNVDIIGNRSVKLDSPAAKVNQKALTQKLFTIYRYHRSKINFMHPETGWAIHRSFLKLLRNMLPFSMVYVQNLSREFR